MFVAMTAQNPWQSVQKGRLHNPPLTPPCLAQENVALMSKFMDLKRFSHIYVVDLCSSLCRQVGAGLGECGIPETVSAPRYTLDSEQP